MPTVIDWHLSCAAQVQKHGPSSFLNVLEAGKNVYSAQGHLAQSNEEILTDIVALYKALGGGWENGNTIAEVKKN